MADVRWDDAVLGRIIGTAPEVVAEVERVTEGICSRANAMGAKHRSGYYHVDHKSPGVGNTPAHYDSDVKVYGRSTVGLIYTGNYSAMQDNVENNTLLKARG